ncbi:MAG: imidazoleglycerol-phosphate dehydratase HisB [Endomicrobium sp.]|jgi:imidazoleglycerol-phosphate dehydratase|nr:imidazoleglycerol-phosphate dehydratase HisB [Endomicrobium sp.]MDR2427512.1 imidazoleglycerol-phosphate dehydratase HisB [Endomicrobium sp.]
MRICEIKRSTKETKIEMKLNLDGTGEFKGSSGIGFFDHMLNILAFYANFDVKLFCTGDLNTGAHHIIEDIGIVFGQALKNSLGDKKGIARFGGCFLPMDEALVNVNLDISGRSYLVFNASFPTERVGNFETELVEEFFRAIVVNAAITLHVNLEYGKNTHHIAEAIFKGFGRAFGQAVEKVGSRVNSSKGVI